MAVWSFAESIVWPVIPDFLLVLLAIGRPRRVQYSLAACIAGSAAGASLMYGLASSRPAEAALVIPYLPLAFEADIATVRERFAHDGALAFLTQPTSGIPFKVWAIVGATSGIPPLMAVPIAILARATRMSLVAIAAALLGARFGPVIRDNWLPLLVVYVVIFTLGWTRTFPSGG